MGPEGSLGEGMEMFPYIGVGCRRERKASSDVSQRVRFFPRVMVAVAVQEASWPPMHFGVPHKQGLYTRESGQC